MNYMVEIHHFEQHLIAEEKSSATVEKYLRDVRCFCDFLTDRLLGKEETISYKEYLTHQYAPASVNSCWWRSTAFCGF